MADQRLNIKFVREVEKYPFLYNYTLPEYVRKDLTEQAWGDIGKKFRLSGSECKEKWKNLRSVFVRHLKPPKIGTSSLKKAYYLAEFMQFALPYIKFTKNRPETNRQETSNSEHNSPLQSILPDEEPASQSMFTQSEELAPTSPSQSSHFELPVGFTSTSQILSSKKTRQNCQSEETKTEQLLAAYFKIKQSKMIENCDNETSSNKMFLLSILPDMNKMNITKRRAFKRRLLDLVDEIIDEDSD